MTSRREPQITFDDEEEDDDDNEEEEKEEKICYLLIGVEFRVKQNTFPHNLLLFLLLLLLFFCFCFVVFFVFVFCFFAVYFFQNGAWVLSATRQSGVHSSADPDLV